MIPLLDVVDITSRWDGPFDNAQLARATQMAADLSAIALQIAPTLGSVGVTQGALAAARAILALAAIRALKSDNGQLSSQSMGPFSMSIDTRTRDGMTLLTRAERAQLAALAGQRRIRSFRLVSSEPAVAVWPWYVDQTVDVPPPR